jgi:hypothetical protein
MLILPQITLCCIDTQFPQLALYALKRSLQGIRFGDVIFITTHKGVESNGPLPPEIRIVEIEPIRNVEEYSRFVLTSISAHIKTSHVLLIQWDGHIINPQAWSDGFLDYDYIGAPWLQKDGSKIVGNGGFSLRSRKLIDALLSEDMQIHHPEDCCIARTNRALLEERYGIRFAEPAIADMFAFEFTKPKAPTFGFHGLYNFPDVMPPEDLLNFVRTMPGHFIFSGYFPMFLERLHSKVHSAPLYGETMSLVQQAISEAFAKADVSRRVPGKNLIKTLIRCQLGFLAKAGLEARIASSGYSAINIRLLARYFGGKLRLHL